MKFSKRSLGLEQNKNIIYSKLKAQANKLGQQVGISTLTFLLAFPEGGYPDPDIFRYYCAVGDSRSVGRALAESHLRACIKAGLKVCGMNGEASAGQWEFQVGIA